MREVTQKTIARAIARAENNKSIINTGFND
jgi:hypothetical protein